MPGEGARAERRGCRVTEESDKGLRRWLGRVFRRLGRIERHEDLEKEIQILVDEGEEKGLISEDEGEMIQGIFAFRDTLVREILVPRTDMVCAPIETPVRDLIALIDDTGHSRIPVYQGSVDNILGILHAKDLLRFWGSERIDLRSILRQPYFIPETKQVREVLRDLRGRKSHLAVVIDEYGGTAGLVTLEDVIEELIGDIMDEYDAEEKWLVEEKDGTLLVDARLDLDELEDELGVEFPEGKFESVGGFVISLLGKVPAPGETVVHEGVELTVVAADNRKIQKIRVRRLAGEGAEDEPREGRSA